MPVMQRFDVRRLRHKWTLHYLLDGRMSVSRKIQQENKIQIRGDLIAMLKKERSVKLADAAVCFGIPVITLSRIVNRSGAYFCTFGGFGDTPKTVELVAALRTA